MCGNSAYSWNTVLTSRRRAGSAVTSTPPSLITPAVGCSNPAIMRSTVVFPDPEGPRIANSSPSATVRSAPSTATIRAAELLPDTHKLDLRIANGSSHIHSGL